MLVSPWDQAGKLEELETKAELMSIQHDTFAHITRAQLKQVFAAIREVMGPPEEPEERPIGFVMPEGKNHGTKAIKRVR